ncbi:alpha/beta fold hydrolase [Leifsonia sp. 21MFCrub1.1]|uniref:alpha/beta fold hydrolase n=1 Tax=Leifsonia sp. 21MFCrub1.1 TaxID=1798223 RepID=UPI0008927DC4|nr:alpha/beta hydrolase [Leifsonia sp. 21MFCrub1.1]SEB09240.1 Pimeloyl-ACP methyl ester carboxylesterase [Leifsonia sp. 21MFCrub1.1]
MPSIEVAPGVRMAYEDRGAGDPIVFVHGWGGSGDVWDYQILDLAPTHRCITVDLRGHGASDKPWGDYNYDMFVEDLHTLITDLDLTEVTLVGWSMGGHIGLRYAHEHPGRIRHLVLTGSGPRFWEAPDAPFGTPSDQVQPLVDAVRWARTETIAGLYGNNFHRDDLSATEQWFVQTGWKVPAFVGLTSFQALIDNDFREILPEIDLPVAVFSGRHDQIWDPRWSEETARLLPNATLTWFENSGHVAFIENRIEWNAALLDVLEGRSPAGSLGSAGSAATA